jgi:hypothetical protein
VAGTLEAQPAYTSYRKAIFEPKQGLLILHETFTGTSGPTVESHVSRIKLNEDKTLTLHFENFNLDAKKQFDLISCPSMKRDENCPYIEEGNKNSTQQAQLETQLSGLKEKCTSEGLVLMKKLYALYRGHDALSETASDDKRCAGNKLFAANTKAAEDRKQIEQCETAGGAGENYRILQCKTFDQGEKPKVVLESTFTIDTIAHRYKLSEKPTKNFDDDIYEPADGSEWYDTDVDGDVISWSDEGALFELNFVKGTGSYVGMDAAFDYKCEVK